MTGFLVNTEMPSLPLVLTCGRGHLFVERHLPGSGEEFLPAGDCLPEGGVCTGTGAQPYPLPWALWPHPLGSVTEGTQEIVEGWPSRLKRETPH